MEEKTVEKTEDDTMTGVFTAWSELLKIINNCI